MRVLGERPSDDRPAERDTWDQAARAVETYRITYQIDPAEPTALGHAPNPATPPGLRRGEWKQAAEQVLDAREHLDIDKQGLGPIEERIARVDGLLPEHDRERALDRATAGRSNRPQPRDVAPLHRAVKPATRGSPRCAR